MFQNPMTFSVLCLTVVKICSCMSDLDNTICVANVSKSPTTVVRKKSYRLNRPLQIVFKWILKDIFLVMFRTSVTCIYSIIDIDKY